MDPISAAASIVGLLGAAAKVSDVLLKFIGNVKGAPKLAQDVLIEVSDVSACLNQLQRYLQGALSTSGSQEQLLMVEQLVVTLSNCVLIFSELEETVESLKLAEPMQPWRLAHWLFKEQTISALLVRMQQSKLSLSLMLTTLTCTTIGEAQSSASQLKALIQQVLDSNLEMSQRMANLEMRTLGYSRSSALTLMSPDMSSDNDSIYTIRPVNDANKGGAPLDDRVETVQEISDQIEKESEDLQGSSFSFTFDQDLNNSRPYARAMKRNSVWSTASSGTHTMSWSCLSGLSLAEISGISVIGLPIFTQELWNGHRYTVTDADLTCVLEKTEIPVIDDTASGRGYRPSKDEERSFEARKGTLSHHRVHSLGGSSAFDPVQTVRNVPVTVGGRPLEPKTIILLGASLAGKTTIYHRLLMTHGNGFTDSEQRRARELVIYGLIEVFQKARREYRKSMPIEVIEHFEVLAYASRDQPIYGIWEIRCYRALIALWSNSEIRSAIENGKDAELNETVPYLMENIDVLFFESTVPEEVLLRRCYRPSRNRHATLQIVGRSCHVYDISGRRSWRKKWVDYFQDVDTFIFVVSLTGYCQTFVEDINANRMQESLKLFESTSRLDGFRTVPIILMLNKIDLLEQCMKEHPIVDYYPEYAGDSDPVAACRFFAEKFSQLDRRLPGYLKILVTSAVEQDDDDFKSKIDELWPELFQQGLTIISEEFE